MHHDSCLQKKTFPWRHPSSRSLKTVASQFVSAITGSLHTVPYGIRWLCSTIVYLVKVSKDFRVRLLFFWITFDKVNTRVITIASQSNRKITQGFSKNAKWKQANYWRCRKSQANKLQLYLVWSVSGREGGSGFLSFLNQVGKAKPKQPWTTFDNWK